MSVKCQHRLDPPRDSIGRDPGGPNRARLFRASLPDKFLQPKILLRETVAPKAPIAPTHWRLI
jgi:hypothetical protein